MGLVENNSYIERGWIALLDIFKMVRLEPMTMYTMSVR